MWPIHPFRKHICILILSMALLTTFISVKDKFKTHQSNTEFQNFSDDSPISVEWNSSNEYFSIENSFIRHGNFSSAKEVRNGNSDNHIIYILGLFELTTKWGRRLEGESEMLAAKLAVQHINSLNILPGYTLELLVNDTKCDPGVGIDRFFHALYSKKTILMLLGAGCSNVSERLANVVTYWNIIQVSFGSTTPALSDRNKFPLFFRTVAPDTSHNNAKISFVKKFEWKVVATFSQSENEFLLPVNHLVTDLERVNISCISTVTFSLDNYREQLKVLKDLDIRIIIGSFSTTMAKKVFCAVFEMNMFGEYVWILQNPGDIWWNTSKYCSTQNIQKAVEGIIFISDFNNILGDEYELFGSIDDHFEASLNVSKLYISKYVRQAYDAVWTIALALKDAEIYYLIDPIEDYQYNRKDMVHRWVEKLENLRFIGLSGPVKFNGADRVGNSIIRQIHDGQMVDIAIYDSIRSALDFKCKTCQKIKWMNKQTPIAQRILKISLVTIPNILFYSIVFISMMGMVASFLCLYFNLHFRKIKSVKLSSPKLNNVAVCGCVLVYSSVILLGFHNSKIKSDTYFSELCSARVYLLSAGFSLAFGSMFAKTYRVHRLFTYSGAGLVKDKLLKDKQLITLILIPLIIDALILTLWVMIDPMEKQLYNLTLEIGGHRGVAYQPQVEVCISHNTEGWYIALFGYKSIILVMGVFMAWKTRHIKVPALNDSQYIGICVYSTVFSTIIVILSNFISNYVVLTYLAQASSILTSTTLTLCLLFLPKLKSILRKVDCEDPIMHSMGLKIESNTRRFILDDTREQICRLEIQNKIYRCEMAALDKEISRLEQLLTCPSTTCSIKSKLSVTEATADCYQLNVSQPVNGWASWPTDQYIFKRKRPVVFLSENKLNVKWVERNNLFGRLKKFFGSFTSVNDRFQQHDRYQDLFKVHDTEKIMLGSTPEVYSTAHDPDASLTKSISETYINNSL